MHAGFTKVTKILKIKHADVLEDWTSGRPRWIQMRRQALVRARVLRLKLNNFLSHRRVVEAGGPVVSLTTFGARLDKVHITIESIGAGIQRPSRLILWLEDDQFERPPATIIRLKARGLEVRRSENYGPHKKYFPYVRGESSFDRPLATADDDVLYPRWWLGGLMDANRSTPSQIHCYRAHRIGLTASTLNPYGTWERGGYGIASIANFATGVSGVIYPPGFLAILKASGDRFLDVCPKADDVWLHKNAVEHDYAVSQVGTEGIHFNVVPGTQAQALMHDNVTAGANDAQIAATYSGNDLQKLAEAIALLGNGVVHK